MSPWIFLRLLFLPALLVTAGLMGGWWNFSVPIACFVLNPIIGFITKNSSSQHKEISFSSNKAYRVIPFLFLVVLVSITCWTIVESKSLSVIEFTGLAISTGIVNSVLGFTLAHEFIHRHTNIERLAGHILLLQNNQPYYGIEHIGGHHVYACTPKDPHTARVGESFYKFLPRSVWMTVINAWEIEARRLARKNSSVISVNNRFLQLVLLQISLDLVVLFWAGWIALLFLILQSFTSVLILNITGYLQHYGLLRKQIVSEKYEKISAHHAWSPNKGNDGFNLFQLDKHADHHIHPSHSYEKLISHEESPHQPTGYAGMMWLALIPPLWFKIMNKRIPSIHQ